MKNGKNLFNNFQNLSGVTFIAINGYLSKTTGEIANHVVNVGLSVQNVKKNDLAKLQVCSDEDLTAISGKSGITIEVCKIALAEMIESAKKNLSEKIEDRTAQSQAQTDAYIFITSAIRLHKDTQELHVFGQGISKKILTDGNYKTVKSSDKTLAKKAITKDLNLSAGKFRDYLIPNVESVKMNGETLEIN
jgi:hypothetical protein